MPRLSPKQREHFMDLIRSGHSARSLEKVFHISPKTAKNWAMRARQPAPDATDRPRSGRPAKITGQFQTYVARIVDKLHTAVTATDRWNKKGGVRVDVTTTRRALRSMKVPRTPRPLLMRKGLSPVNAAKRADFCRSFAPTRYRPWVFLDGTIFALYTGRMGDLNWAWQRADRPLRKAPGKLVAYYFVYAAVARGWKSKLHFLPPSTEPGSGSAKSKVQFESEHFVKFMGRLKGELVAHFGSDLLIRIIRDRAPQHVSKAAQRALAPLNLPILLSFPPQSWDINCIEHVWAGFKKLVHPKRPVTAGGYKRAIKKAWASLDQAYINKLVSNVPKRLLKIVNANGAWIDHYKN